MKKILTPVMLLAVLMMALCLSACGGGETASAPAEADVDLAALRTQMIADNGIADYMEVETPGLTNLYGIDAAQVAASASFQASAGTAFPQEIVMVRAVDEAAAADIAAKLENRLASIADQASSYDPDSLALAQSCGVITNGTYVGMFFSASHEAMSSAFLGALS